MQISQYSQRAIVWIVAAVFAIVVAGGVDAMPAPPSPEKATQAETPLTLADALSRALRESPMLAAFAWDLRAADAMVKQAGLRENPELAIEIEGIRWDKGPSERTTTVSGGVSPRGLSPIGWEREVSSGAARGFGESELTISIGYLVELGRKRAKRTEVAQQEKALLEWDYQAARADVLERTARDFIDVLAGQESLALGAEMTALAEEAARAFALRVDAGQISPLELARAEVTLAGMRAKQLEREQAMRAARSRLAANWGDTFETLPRVAGDLTGLAAPPGLDELLARMTDNPDLARWSTELTARRATLRLEQAQRIPDLGVELGLKTERMDGGEVTSYGFDSAGGFGVSRTRIRPSEDRNSSLVVGFSLPLPIFNRNQGSIVAAEAMVSKAGAGRRAAEVAARAELTASHAEVVGAHALAFSLRDTVLPKARETYEKVRQGYDQGKFGYLDVLEAQRAAFEARESFLDAVQTYHHGVIRIERLTGGALAHHTEVTNRELENSTDED